MPTLVQSGLADRACRTIRPIMDGEVVTAARNKRISPVQAGDAVSSVGHNEFALRLPIMASSPQKSKNV
jgi:hypothetical protein